MIADKIKELEILRAKTALLETQIAAERNRELSTLPAQYGFENAATFIAAVRAATNSGPGRRGRKPAAAEAAIGATSKRRRRRATITDETRSQVKKLAGEGKTGSEIAAVLRISVPSVQNIKKALGLVRKRKK